MWTTASGTSKPCCMSLLEIMALMSPRPPPGTWLFPRSWCWWLRCCGMAQEHLLATLWGVRSLLATSSVTEATKVTQSCQEATSVLSRLLPPGLCYGTNTFIRDQGHQHNHGIMETANRDFGTTIPTTNGVRAVTEYHLTVTSVHPVNTSRDWDALPV
ncbi:hypothetical protein ASZ78_010964 [Callipepla squamata]|uniref:Uncharacterized protein n=1 Tax=Callipepla squamata TaxID=9009 RepID=A0A226MAZ0_CALSU|nr:hypothetical protein ASZ78_010964 [Callipepla squamata]